MTTIYEWERAFLLKDWKITKILNPWKHNQITFFWNYKTIKVNINSVNPKYDWVFKENLINNNKELLKENFYNFDIWETEIWILYRNWKINRLLKWWENYLFWRWNWTFECEIIDISENNKVEKKLIKKIKTIEYNFDLSNIIFHETIILKMFWFLSKIKYNTLA
jgi:hypothetical protein